jgi:uncharacterized protein YecA (UPF0149 family)
MISRHRWMVFMPFEVAPSDARKMAVAGELPTVDEVPATELAAGEVPAAEDPRPWFGMHNVVHDLVSVGCYVCEQPYSDEAEAAGCPGDPNGADLRLPPARAPGTLPPNAGLRAVGRNERCPCGSGLKWKQCHGR